MYLNCEPHSLFLTLVVFSFSTIFIGTTTSIAPGSTLYASNTKQAWTSPSATFSLRFLAVEPPTSPPSFTASIVYTGGDPVVWSAANGTTVEYGGSFQFLSSGALRLVNCSGGTVWDSGTANLGATNASVEDSGYLVISNGTRRLWSSFDHPVDTLLPSQKFIVGKVLNSGPYSFSLSRIGELTLKWNGSIEFWNQGLDSSVKVNLSSPFLELLPSGVLQLSDTNLSTTVAYSSDYGGSDNLRVLKLDSDGNLRIYSTSSGSGNPTATWAAIHDQCEVYAYCENYGICSYNDSGPICGCPSGNFEMVYPNDSRQGCRRKMSLDNCKGDVALLRLDHTQLLTNFPETESQSFFVGTSGCSQNCLTGSDACYASTSLSDGTGKCYQKSSANFVSGYHSPTLTSISFIKVCPPVVQNPSFSSAGTVNEKGSGGIVNEKGSKVRARVVVVIIMGTLIALINLFLLYALTVGRRLMLRLLNVRTENK